MRIRQGREGEAVGELEQLVREHPLRERLWALLARALYRAHRQGDALAALRRAREHLADELGVDPGPELRRLEDLVLRQDPSLDEVDPLPTPVEAPAGGCSGRDAGPAGALRPGRAARSGHRRPARRRGRPRSGRRRQRRARHRQDAVHRGRGRPRPSPGARGRHRRLGGRGEPAAVGVATGADHAARRCAAPRLRRRRRRRVGQLPAGRRGGGGRPGPARRRCWCSTTCTGPTPRACACCAGWRPSSTACRSSWWPRRGRPRPRSVRPWPRRSRRSRGSTRCASSSPASRPDAIAAWVSEHAGVAVTEEVAGALAERTDGNPFHVTELVRLLVGEGALTSRDAAAWRPCRAGCATSYASGSATWTRRWRRCSAIAAVVGRSFDVVVVGRAAKAPADVVDDAVEAALMRGLVDVEEPGRYRFTHALVRDAIYDGVAAPARARAHADVALALEDRYAGRLLDHVGELAEHYRQAGPGARPVGLGLRPPRRSGSRGPVGPRRGPPALPRGGRPPGRSTRPPPRRSARRSSSADRWP